MQEQLWEEPTSFYKVRHVYMRKSAYSCSCIIHLTVSLTVPPVLSVPRLEYTAVLGQPVSLECSADGQPKPEVTWHRERRPVVEGTHLRLFSNGTLHITATQRSDAGIYTCSARNNAGRASHDIRVILQSEFQIIPR